MSGAGVITDKTVDAVIEPLPEGGGGHHCTCETCTCETCTCGTEEPGNPHRCTCTRGGA